MRSRFGGWVLVTLLWVPFAEAQAEAPTVVFRRGNENAAHSRWDDAILEYGRLAESGVGAPSLYWNWAQAASASGRKGEALWALMRARDLTPTDTSMIRETERLRGELGLDPSEMSLGLLGDLRMLARRFRFDGLAIAALFLSVLALLGKKPRASLSLGSLLLGLLLATPSFLGSWREPRGVVVQKDAPLVDAPRTDALALANLREGEVVPLLGEEGDYVRIQDASGARGFAHKNDVRKVGMP
jgi:hypothetical protein